MNFKKILSSSFISIISLGFSVIPTFASYSLFNNASIVSGGNPGNAAQIISDSSAVDTYGGVDFSPSSPIAWGSLTTLSLDYNITDDNCGGGSPRVSLGVDTNADNTADGYVHIALGPSPSFTGCAAGWQSTGNLIGNVDAGRFDYSQFGGSTFTTYANSPAIVQSGNVVSAIVVVDGSWSAAATGGDGEQTVLVDNLTLNSDIEGFEPYPVSGAITNPANNGDHVSGAVNFTATYDDGDTVNDDAVQWAIRQGTCAAATNTVFGNVDGRSDTFSWDGALFSSLLDTSSLVPGDYCFVFNPTDDPGQNDVRVTRTFIVDAVAPTITPTATPTPVIGPPTSKDQCRHGGWRTFNNPTFRNEDKCEDYVERHKVRPGKAEGDIRFKSPRQKMEFEVTDAVSGPDKGHLEYWNYDYPGVLHYKAKALCVNVNKSTKESRFMFQIPSGHPGLSGIYVVSYVKDGGTHHNSHDLYGHSSTFDLSTAQDWCNTGNGFTPTMYSITNGNVVVH